MHYCSALAFSIACLICGCCQLDEQVNDVQIHFVFSTRIVPKTSIEAKISDTALEISVLRSKHLLKEDLCFKSSFQLCKPPGKAHSSPNKCKNYKHIYAQHKY